MIELLKVFLSLSLSGAFLIFILLLFKPVLRKKLSNQCQYYIWLIVIARLLLPFTPETSLVGNLFQRIDTTIQGIYEYSGQDLPQTEPILNDVPANNSADIGNSEQPAPTEQKSEYIFQVIKQNIWVLWLLVATALLIRKITTYQSFVKYIKAGQVEITDLELWEQFGRVVTQSGVKRTIGIYTNSLISSPLLIGFFRPCIMLPTTELSTSDFQYTLLHELTHFRRMDMFYKWLVQLTICLHWFNPLVYFMGKEINRACELSCDEAVIKKLDTTGRRAYGDTLLNALGVGGNYKNSLASVTLTENKEIVKERLDAIMDYKRSSKLVVAISLAIAIMLATGATAIGAYAMPHLSIENSKNTEITPKPIDNTQQEYAILSSGKIPANISQLDISFNIDNGGVVIQPASSGEIEALYDSEYYDVSINNEQGMWVVSVSGKVARMGDTDHVQLSIPDIKCIMDVNVNNGNFSYALPKNCTDKISITAKNSGIDFASKNKYQNVLISLMATDKDFIKYVVPVYPDYFTKTNNGFEYSNGTEENIIDIKLTGYSSVNFDD